MNDQEIYETATNLIQDQLTVPQIKNILRHEKLSVYGRKAQLQDRLFEYLKRGHTHNNRTRVHNIYALVLKEIEIRNQLRNGVSSTAAAVNGSHTNNDNDSTYSQSQGQTYSEALHNSSRTQGSQFNPVFSARPNMSSSTANHLYIPPIQVPSATVPVVSKILFKPSPFYHLRRMLHPPLVFLKSVQGRQLQKMQVYFTREELAGIRSKKLGVLIASTIFNDLIGYSTSLLQFPTFTELRVNSKSVNGSLKGIRGLPGSTKPPMIGDMIYHNDALPTLIDVIVAFGQKETESYIVTAYTVDLVSMEEMLDNIKARPMISKDSTIQRSKYWTLQDELTLSNSVVEENNDEDVVATASVQSLKCPLAFTRIVTPIRSINCQHIECFDAMSYLQLQDQAPTWKCPVCSKSAEFDSLAVDE